MAAVLRRNLRLVISDWGQDLVEYAILSGVIGLAAATAYYAAFGPEMFDGFVEKVQACIAFDRENCRPA